eukprot:c18770_g1_i1 orf=228-860(+)
MLGSRLSHMLALLLLVRSLLPCEASSDHFSKKAGGATASVFLFLLPKVAEESAKAVGKVSVGSVTPPPTAESTEHAQKNDSRLAMAASLYDGSKEAMACLYNETKQAMACLYNETMHAVALLYNESKQAMAIACPPSCFRPNPVCGKDGITYWCGLADAECAGAEVDHIGFCDFGSRDTGGKGVLAVQSLLLVHMIWLMLAAFLVLLGVP